MYQTQESDIYSMIWSYLPIYICILNNTTTIECIKRKKVTSIQCNMQ